jgi:hypothetical protein
MKTRLLDPLRANGASQHRSDARSPGASAAAPALREIEEPRPGEAGLSVALAPDDDGRAEEESGHEGQEGEGGVVGLEAD